MTSASVWKPSGILNLKEGQKKFELTRHAASPDLAFFVQRYWIVKWDLRGQAPYYQENLPHPCVNLIFEKNKSQIYGVETGKGGYLLQGQGQVFGIKFRPGGFYPFFKRPVSELTDRAIGLTSVFGTDGHALETSILALNDAQPMIKLAEDFLRANLPPRDEQVLRIGRIIECIVANSDITRVDQVVSRLNISKRTLQRLFSQYVGVSPKWVIKQYRLHEAADQLAEGEVTDWPRLAQELGYFDQAHFIKEFKHHVGQSPAQYARHAGAAS